MDDLTKTSQTFTDDPASQKSQAPFRPAFADASAGKQGSTGQAGQTQTLNAPNPVPQPAPPAAPKLKEQLPIQTARPLDSSRGSYAEADKVAKEEGDEYWENYAREIELEKQILEMGGLEKVEAGEVPIPKQVADEMGISPTVGAHTTMASATGFSIAGTSLSDDQLSSGIKLPTSSGFRWLVEWFIYQLLKAHFHIRRTRGAILREKPTSS